jgi:dihydroorotase-like cyclic amidohydrolase
MPALEEYLPLMLTAVHADRLTLPQVVRLACENPARLFGLWPRKGRLAEGADADLVLVDTRATWVHDHRELETKARGTALMYDGFRMHGRAVRVFVRGRPIMTHGSVVGDPGWGQWIRPS